MKAAWFAAGLALLCGTAHAQLWWPGFIDAKGKAFLELPADAKRCALAHAALRRTDGAPGQVIVLPLKVETLLPRGARLAFGIVDAAGVASERVFTRVVAIRHEGGKGACAHLAESGAEAPGHLVEEDRLAFGAHPPRPLRLAAAHEGWRSYGGVGEAKGADGRFQPAADVPREWHARLAPLLPGATDWFGQRFDAVLEAGRPAQALMLMGAFANQAGGATYNTVNLIVRDAAAEGPFLYQAGPSGGIERDRAGSFVAELAGVIDLDGDGVDEVVLRVRHYSGGNLKILKFANGRFSETRQTAYEGD